MKLVCLILLFKFFVFGCSLRFDINNLNSPDIVYFLPNHTVPNHYDIQLNLTIGPDYFYDGFVAINISVYESTKTITLHIDKENITEVYLTQDQNKINISHFDINLNNTFFTLHLINELQPGNYILNIKFNALYYEGAGLMLSWYESNGNKKPLLATHFEPVYTRRMIPCFDEPKLKATFQMEITHPEIFNATSNTEILDIKTIGSSTVTKFKKTPPMSTYLLALTVSEYKSYEKILDNTKFQILVPSNRLNESIFALNITRDSVNAFQRILKVNYSLPKLDGVVVPTFGGGMENWGLIVYGPMILEVKTESGLQSVTELICHEVAHQWFGNLVTCYWWDYTWLNEGFATHYASLCADAILGNNSSRRFMYEHVIGMQHILQEDSSNYTKSLNFHVEHPYMIWSKFSNISYQKGSAIVRFMSLILKNFNEAITKYLTRYSFGTAIPNQLFEILNEKAYLPFGTNVSAVMKNWVENPGYPLLTINITRHGKKAIVLFKQERFFIDPKIKSSSERWWIPITLAFGGNPHFDTIHVFDWLRDNDDSIVMYLDDLGSNWLLGNVQSAVFCRVNYDLDNWNKIIDFLKSPDYKKIHVLNRARLIDDANNLVKAQKLPQNILLELLTYLKQEEDPLVKKLGKSVLTFYGELLKTSPIYSKYLKFVYDIYDDNTFILNEHDFGSFIENVMNTAGKSEQQSYEELNNVMNRVFLDEDYRKVKTFVSSLIRSEMSLKRIQMADKLDQIYEMNKIIKNNFWNGESYNKISKWLNERY